MATYGIILSFFPAIVWLIFYLHEDLHPEPKRLIALTFFMGAAFAFLALIAEKIIDCNAKRIAWNIDCLSESGSGVNLVTIAPLFLIAFALIEELCKFLAAYFTVNKNPAFDEPVDAMIYTIVAALGFATVENFGALHGQATQTALLSDIFSLTASRFVGATLLHTLSSAVLGYYWAISIREFGAKRFIIVGIALATALHAFFNYLIILYGDLIYAVIFVIILSLFVLSDFEKLKRRSI